LSSGPVFLAGLSDSGKTPLGRILTDRTGIVITRQTQLWRRFAGKFGDLRDTSNLERCLATLLSDPAVMRLELDVDRFRASLRHLDLSSTAIFSRLHAQHAEQLGKYRWGEQCSVLETYADRLLRDLPDARVIHLIRDPVVSYRVASGRGGIGPGRLGRFTARWVASMELARTHAERFPDRYLVVRYESLASRTDETLRAICGFLGEPIAVADSVVDGGTQLARDGGLVGGSGKYASDAGRAVSGSAGEEARFLVAHAAGELRLHGYEPPEAAIGRPGPAYLARWPANRFALAISRGHTPAAWPSWPGG
jgi:hypothetical protein